MALARGIAATTAADGTVDDRELAMRISAVRSINPYMSDDPQALVSMATMPVSTDDLVAHAGQLYAMQTGNKLADQLRGMSKGSQRTIFSRLAPNQQQSLVQMGYQPPERDNDSLLRDFASLAAKPLGVVSHGAMAIPGVKEAIGGTLEGLTWLGNWPGHLYRTARMQDQGSQWAALTGGLAGLAAVALAVPTGGGSLMALGALGLGATAGMTAGSMMTAREDWFRAFNQSWNGERVFKMDAQRHAEQLLGDPRAVGAAQDLSAAGIDVVEFAKELAGHRGGDRNSQMRLIAERASTMAAEGTPENQQIQNMMFNMLQEPTFQEAIQTLNNGKISPGRDLASTLGLHAGSSLYNVISGTTDATFTVAVDPTLLLGWGAELAKAKRMTFDVFQGAEAATAFKKFVYSRKTVLRGYSALAEAVDASERGGLQILRTRAPQMESLYADLLDYKQALRDTGELTRPFDHDHVIEYLSNATKFAPLQAGKGSIKNVRGIQLIGVSAPKMAFREFRGEIRAITNGMSDVATEAKAMRLARQRGVDFEVLLPPSLADEVGADGVVAQPWRFNQHNPTGYAIGRAFAEYTRKIPVLGRSVGKVGDALTAMTTMSIAGKGVHLVGDQATKEIRALSELGRYMGMPSYMRQAWADTILSSDSPAARMDLLHGWMSNMLRMTGVDATDEGEKLLDRYLRQSRKLYGQNDQVLVNGEMMHAGMFLNDQADIMVMPDLREMRKAATASYMAKGVFGVVDHPVLETMMNKVWKPAVLLRIGFIPRAAGEELASFMLRSGIGSLTQEAGARFIGKRLAYEDALQVQRIAQAEGYTAKLTRAEQQLLDRGWIGTLPAHIRPLVRMLQRIGFEDPALRKFDDYGRWLAERLQTGLGKSPDELLARFGGQALDAPRLGTDRAVEAARLGLTPLERPQIARLNVADYANSIFLGNPYSVRRMMLGGVHNDLVEAGTEWARTHSTTVMREASAITNGPIDPGYDASDIHREWQVDPRTDELRPVTVMVEKGRRVVYALGDRYHHGAVLENITRSLEDPIIERAAIEHLSRVRSPGVDEARLAKATDALFDMGSISGDVTLGSYGEIARDIVAEHVGKFNRDHWDQMVTRMLQHEPTAPMGLALQTYLKDLQDPTITDVIGALRNARADLVRADFRSAAQFRQVRAMFSSTAAQLEDHALPTMQWLDGLGVADRRMAGQFIYGQLRGGERSFWAKRRIRETPADEKFLYESLDEAMNPMIDQSATLVLDPHMHDHGVPNSIRGTVLDDEGQFVDTQMRSATVTLYQAPDLRGMSYDQILGHANNRELIVENRPVIEAMLANPNEGQTALLSNYALAKELHAVNVRSAGLDASIEVRPKMMRRPRQVTDGRVHGMLFPDTETKLDGDVRLWHMPNRVADKRLEPTPDELLDPAREWATKMNSRLHDVIRRQNRQTRVVKGRAGEPLADGTPTIIPTVHRFENGDLEPIMPGSKIDMSHANQLHNAQGKPIVWGDQAYFEDEAASDVMGEAHDAMWEALGPAMQDAYDRVHNAQSFRRKHVNANPTSGDWYRPQQSNDIIPLSRSSVVDIDHIPGDDLPTHAIGELYRNKPIGNFDKMVQFGFDRVIGPSIDAIVRKPMAFHAFANRYTNAKQALNWAMDPELVGQIDHLVREYGLVAHKADLDPENLARMARSIAGYHGDRMAAKWTTNDAMAWLRSHSEGEMADLLTRTVTSSAHDSSAAGRLANVHAIQLSKQDFGAVKAALANGTDTPSFIKAIESKLPEGALRSRRSLFTAEASKAIATDPLLSWITKNDHWDTILAAKKNIDHVRKTAGELAAVAAIGDVVPFLDSHEFKTQFADYAKGMLPFWYAEENFLKRWGRGLADEGFPLIRKAQLAYMGMKSAGVIRTDEAGRDWFVYPGSGLLADALQRIPGMAGLQNVGVMFESPTDQMLPGMNNRFGTPSFSPLVTMPMEMVMKIAPELQPVERAVLGDFASGQGITDMIIPAHFRNLYHAIATGEEGNPRFASAMMTAMAFLEAHGQGIPDNASAGQVDEYMDRLRNHARIVVLAQALGGFFTPGSPSEIAAGNSASLTGLGVDNPSEYLASEYVQLVRSLGIEDGTAKFLELNKDATIDDVVSPLAYTTPRNATTSGAPIPSTENALQYYDDNADYMSEFPNAGPWLLPQVYDQADRSQYAYDQQTADGLRKRRTPDEFFRAMKFKVASTEYFATRDAFQAKIDAAKERGDANLVKSLTAKRDTSLGIYRMAHPIFTEELQSSDGKQQRQRTLNEMRTVVDDPQHPDTPHFKALQLSMHAFDTYSTRLRVLNNDRSTRAQRQVQQLKEQYQGYMTRLVDENPAIMSFWVSVLRPESSLD